MKTNIKMRVTPEQSKRVQEICFDNNIEWSISKKNISDIRHNNLFISNSSITYGNSNGHFKAHEFIEIDADLFIRTNGTCEETFKEQQSYNDSDLIIKDDNIYMIGNTINKHNDITILEQKLKKKNEILKKARIKRKNQREQLHKLNLKLQKCISLGEHRKVINWHIERNESLFAEIDNLKAENIEMGKLVNLNRSALGLMGATKDLSISRVEEQNNEIEKLKVVIEYLESKVK